MHPRWTVVWRVAKVLLAVAIIASVGWQFSKLLNRSELWARPLRLNPWWLAACCGLYALCFACWGGYWLSLVRSLGENLPWPHAVRAYFVSQLGKYVPGKAVAIVMRVSYARAAGTRTGVAAITATYETLTTIAAGALLAAILLPIVRSADTNLGWKALGLLAIAGIPILPGVFNRLAARVARPFLPSGTAPLPRLSTAMLLGGLAQTAVGWVCLGTSLLALLAALDEFRVPWLVCVAYAAVSYVAGFVTLPAPGGLGVREAILQQLLAAELAPVMTEQSAASFAVVVVLLLRLTWTVTELSLAGLAAGVPRLAIGKPAA